MNNQITTTTQNTPRATGNSKHTPGPWFLFQEHPANIAAKLRGEGNGMYDLPALTDPKAWGHFRVSTPCGEIVSIQSMNPGARQREANARLIAAAPELLEALKACADQLNIETLGGEALDHARAILAKLGVES
jgi:hypothetical protein